MDSAIVVALITGGVSILGVILTNMASNSKIEHSLDKAQAVMDNKIENLTEEVRKHNAFAERIPKIEARIDALKDRIDKMEG